MSPPQSLPSMKLTYFDFGGRADITRFTLAFAGISFDNHIVSPEAFQAIKSTLPLNQVPVLEVDGTVHCQSMAIARYVGRLTGLYPTDARKAFEVDAAVETLNEVLDAFVAIKVAPVSEKPAMTRAYMADRLPRAMSYLESRVQGKFLLGDEASIADTFLFDINKNVLETTFAGFDMAAYPKIRAVIANVGANPGVAAFLTKQ